MNKEPINTEPANDYVPVPPNDGDYDWGIGAEVGNDEPAEEQKGEPQ